VAGPTDATSDVREKREKPREGYREVSLLFLEQIRFPAVRLLTHKQWAIRRELPQRKIGKNTNRNGAGKGLEFFQEP